MMARPALHLAVVVLLALLPGVRVLCADSCLALPPEPSRTAEPACHGAHGDDTTPHLPDAPGSETGCDHDDVSRARPAAKIGPDGGDTLAAVAAVTPHVAVVPFVRPVIADRTPAPAVDPGGFLSPLRC